MCKFKSGIILKNKVVLTPEGNESRSDLLESLGIEDNRFNAETKFVRVELLPKDNNKATDISEWTYKVDQDILPDWYEADPEKYKAEFRGAVKDYLKDKFKIIAGRPWTVMKTEGNRTYYLLDGILEKSKFGKTNNYAMSYIRKKLNNGDLAKALKEEFGNKLVPITTDLLSLDGLDDYGKVEGDILAIPTLDLYRECRKSIPKIDKWWWLATPDSTPSGCGAAVIRCIDGDGCVSCSWHEDYWAVRPFFIVES